MCIFLKCECKPKQFNYYNPYEQDTDKLLFTTSNHEAYVDQYRLLTAASDHQQRLLVISFGGFRYDYIDTHNLVNFAKFYSESGVRASRLQPQFPTHTFSNQWSLVTGSYVEKHGMIGNNFYDSYNDEFFQLSKQGETKWYGNLTETIPLTTHDSPSIDFEPIWFTATRFAIKTGVFSWPGSDAIFYDTPFYRVKKHRSEIDFNRQIQQAIHWFDKDNYKFILMYNDQLDHISQKYGIDSREFNVTLIDLDAQLGNLIDKLESFSIYNANNFNMIIVSDHGMTNIRKNIIIDEYFSEADAIIWSFSRSVIHLKPLVPISLLLMKLNRMPNVNVYTKQNIPEWWHFTHNERIGEIVITAHEGIAFIYMGNEPLQMMFNGQTSVMSLTRQQKKQLLLVSADKASDGYDNGCPSMRVSVDFLYLLYQF
jgi:ectonucleotide pyrophosphatase/phosphodiesterase family member 5